MKSGSDSGIKSDAIERDYSASRNITLNIISVDHEEHLWIIFIKASRQKSDTSELFGIYDTETASAAEQVQKGAGI